MSSKTSRRSGALVAATIGLLALSSALGVAQAQPSPTLAPVAGAAGPSANLPDIRANATFDRLQYHAGDAATITLTITNKGTATAIHVRRLQIYHRPYPNDAVVDPASWGDLSTNGPGVDLAAGASTTVDLHAVIPDGAASTGSVSFHEHFTHDGSGAHYSITSASVTAAVVKAHGSLSGVVYYQRNGKGEGVAELKISLFEAGVANPTFGSAVTDASGTFHFVDTEVGCHWLEPDRDSAWMLPPDQPPLDYCVKRTNPVFVSLRVVPRNGVLPTSIRPSTTASAPVTSVPATTSTAAETTGGVAGQARPTITTTTTKAPRALASTGADVGPFLAIGTLAVATGIGAIVLTRLRKRANS